MPSPRLIQPLATLKFQSYHIKLPAQAAVVPDRSVRLGVGVAASSAAAIAAGLPHPPATTPPSVLFAAASDSSGDVEVQKSVNAGYSLLFDRLTEGIRFGWDKFREQAYFKNITINAVSALGVPGCLEGPAVDQFIRTAPTTANWTGWWAGIRDGVAAGFQDSWKVWQGAVTVTGLPWYPAFAAFPGPAAPPMPNTPCPLVACVSAGMSSMAAPTLTSNLSRHLTGRMEYPNQFSEALAAMIGPAFIMWLGAQQVTSVLGHGPVPTFAPPYVPVGPVVMGTVVSVPGHLAT